MIGVEDSAVAAVARRVAQRAGIVRSRPRVARLQVPALRVSRRPTGDPPTVWMVCPSWNRPSGGIRKQYRAVDVLNDAGVSAAIVHSRPGFQCTWFEHTTRIIAATDVVVREQDVIAVPEIYWSTIRDLPAGIRQVIFNQNAYLTLDSLVEGGAAAEKVWVDNPDLVAAVAVSDENAHVLRYMFPSVPIKRVHHGIDPAVHYPPAENPRRRIAYMPRRRSHDASQVLRLLELQGVLGDWEVVRIEGCKEHEVADMLRTARIFLSLSEREGFGLPPCEALACGCLVAGFDGFAGREFFRSPFALAVENGDVVGLARTVEGLMRFTEDDPLAASTASALGARFVRDRYSPAVERRDLVDVFAPLLGVSIAS